MATRRDDPQTAAQAFKAAMGSHPCDAKTAYILLRETEDIFKDFKDEADRCLPEVMRDLIIAINELQLEARASQPRSRTRMPGSSRTRRRWTRWSPIRRPWSSHCSTTQVGPAARSRGGSPAWTAGEFDIAAARAGRHSAAVQSRPPKTAVCVLRVENQGPSGIRIPVTTSPTLPRRPGAMPPLASDQEALSLGQFLRDHASPRESGPNVF